MSPRARRFVALSGGIGIGVAVLLLAHRPAQAQGMVRPEGPGPLHFATKIGSFKMLGNEDKPVTGTLTMTAKGTVLVSGVNEKPQTTGSLRLEYSYEPLKKYCYHGQGTLIIKGPLRSVQWFGTDLTADFLGRGKFRLVGEFDKNLSTGTYWTTDPNKKEFWPANSVVETLVPGFSSSTPLGTKTKMVPVPTPPPSKPDGK